MTINIKCCIGHGIVVCCNEELIEELAAAAKAALELLTGTGQDGTMGHHKDNPVPAQLRTALKLTKEAP